MKIVNLPEFLAMSNNVIFSQIGAGGLHRRGDAIEDHDFFYTVIVPATQGEDLDDIGNKQRWGDHDQHARFVVFDDRDLNEINAQFWAAELEKK